MRCMIAVQQLSMLNWAFSVQNAVAASSMLYGTSMTRLESDFSVRPFVKPFWKRLSEGLERMSCATCRMSHRGMVTREEFRRLVNFWEGCSSFDSTTLMDSQFTSLHFFSSLGLEPCGYVRTQQKRHANDDRPWNHALAFEVRRKRFNSWVTMAELVELGRSNAIQLLTVYLFSDRWDYWRRLGRLATHNRGGEVERR